MSGQALTSSEISQIVAMAPPHWEVVRHDSYDETMIAMLFGASASAEPYCISRTARGISLAVSRDDSLVELGRSATVTEMMAAFTALVGASPSARRRETLRHYGGVSAELRGKLEMPQPTHQDHQGRRAIGPGGPGAGLRAGS
jgi:hypothetical protein